MSNYKIIEKIRYGFEPVSRDSKWYNSKYPFTNCALIFAYNGTGKTRLSYDFAHYRRKEGSPQHTLYYNAYTEDLFTWDNDLENNTDHHLLINQNAALIQGLAGSNFSEPLRKYLQIFTDFQEHGHGRKVPAVLNVVDVSCSLAQRQAHLPGGDAFSGPDGG